MQQGHSILSFLSQGEKILTRGEFVMTLARWCLMKRVVKKRSTGQNYCSNNKG